VCGGRWREKRGVVQVVYMLPTEDLIATVAGPLGSERIAFQFFRDESKLADSINFRIGRDSPASSSDLRLIAILGNFSGGDPSIVSQANFNRKGKSTLVIRSLSNMQFINSGNAGCGDL
jgi:hypothetical protein